MSTARIPDFIKRTRGSANRALQEAGNLAQRIADNMNYKAGVYDVPDLNDALADLAAAMDAIKTARAVIEQANPINVRTVVVGSHGAVGATVTERVHRTRTQAICPHCKGTSYQGGMKSGEDCPTCGGIGTVARG